MADSPASAHAQRPAAKPTQPDPAAVLRGLLASLMAPNGPVEVGVSAGTDNLGEAMAALPNTDHIGTMRRSLWVPPRSGALAVRVACTAAQSLAIHHGWRAPGRTRIVDVGTAPDRAEIPDDAWETTAEDLNRMLLVVVGTKVHFWQTNHHTGQTGSAAVGFAAKAMQSAGLDPDRAADVVVAHMVGHWFDTRMVLSRLGIPGLATGAPKAWDGFHITGSDDVRLRVSSCPAGTATLVDSMVAMEGIVTSGMISILTEEEIIRYAGLKAWVDSAERVWARHHMGSQYLTGQPRLDVPSVPDSLRSKIKAFVETVLPGSTLSRAASFRGVPTNQMDVQRIGSIIREARAHKVSAATALNSMILARARGEGAPANIDELISAERYRLAARQAADEKSAGV